MDKNIGLQEEGVLPGFRFHPTEEELLNFYLRRTAMGINTTCSKVIGFLNIYHHHPSELPGLAKITGEREWYFFVHRDRKHGHGGRPARTTEHGFWKATGSDRQIRSLSEPKMILGLKKTLVFYKGRAPKGIKTDWIMNEYRLPDIHNNNKIPPPKEDIVLCKIYRKATSLKILEQRAAAMEDHHQHKIKINGTTDHPISSWSSSPPSDEDSSTIDDPTNAYDHLESWFNNNTSTPSFITATLNHQDNNIDYFEEDCDPAAAAVSIPPPLPPPSVESCSAVMCDMKDQAYTCGDHSFNTPFVWMEQWSPYSNIHDF